MNAQPIAPVAPVTPIQPVQPTQPIAPVQTPAPVNNVDVNTMIANIEAETIKQQQVLRQQIMTEAEKTFNDKLSAQSAETNQVMSQMKSQLDALTQASEEQKRTVVEEYKKKLSDQATQIHNIEGELGQRQSNIPNQANPYRQTPQQGNQPAGTLDPVKQKAELTKMYNAVSGRPIID